MGSHFLLQGIFLTQESNLSLLLGRQILYHLSHLGSPPLLTKKYGNHRLSGLGCGHLWEPSLNPPYGDFLELPSGASVRASHCGGFSDCTVWALGCGGFSNCSWWAPQHRLSSCVTWALLPRSLWDLPGSWMEAMPSALAGRCLTTGAAEKSYLMYSCS